MSVEFKFKDHEKHEPTFSSKIKVTDLISRLREEEKVEKKRNLALGAAVISAVTVFGIILTI